MRRRTYAAIIRGKAMNTNDNTEPCPTCSMAVNKSAIKLAARVAELEATLRSIANGTAGEEADGWQEFAEDLRLAARTALTPVEVSK
jgi:predicted transcriptional regulator